MTGCELLTPLVCSLHRYRFDEYTANLANQSHDRFVGTKDEVAKVSLNFDLIALDFY